MAAVFFSFHDITMNKYLSIAEERKHMGMHSNF